MDLSDLQLVSAIMEISPEDLAPKIEQCATDNTVSEEVVIESLRMCGPMCRVNGMGLDEILEQLGKLYRLGYSENVEGYCPHCRAGRHHTAGVVLRMSMMK